MSKNILQMINYYHERHFQQGPCNNRVVTNKPLRVRPNKGWSSKFRLFFLQVFSQASPHPGSMTPLSYAKWQHGVEQGHRRKHNPLYDTPPASRRQQQLAAVAAAQQQQQFLLSSSPHEFSAAVQPDEQFLRFQLEQQQHHQLLLQQQQLGQQQLGAEIRGVVGNPLVRQQLPPRQLSQQQLPPMRQLSQQLAHQQLRPPQQHPSQLLHFNGGPSRHMADPLLSPILTDQEMSPLHAPHNPQVWSLNSVSSLFCFLGFFDPVKKFLFSFAPLSYSCVSVSDP